MTHLKIYGPQRSGTNYLKALLEQNWPSITVGMHQGKNGVKGGWKHGPGLVPADGYIVINKHPYAFLNSWYRWIDRNPVQRFGDWIKWKTNPMWHVHSQYGALLLNWVFSNKYWVRNLGRDPLVPQFHTPRAFIQYEELIENPNHVLDWMAGRFKLPERRTYLQVKKRVLPADHENELNLSHKKFDPTYYIEQKWLQEFHPGEIRLLNQWVKRRGLHAFVRYMRYSLPQEQGGSNL